MGKLLRYKLECGRCEYVWVTRYPRIPAQCPSCSYKIYQTGNYEIISEIESGCFIITAVYGSPLAEEINLFRIFRDRKLLKSAYGQAFVTLYYQKSPSFSRMIEHSTSMKNLIRILILEPIKLVLERHMCKNPSSK